TRDDPQHRGLARARRSDERHRALDRELQAQLEAAKRKRDVDSEGRHLSTTSRAALSATSSALIASAVSKLTLNSEYTANGSVSVTPRRLPANMIVAPNS